jgi:NhaC family Na+:H+ antiporter
MTKKRPLNLFLALLPILAIIVTGLMSVVYWNSGMNIPILTGIIVAALVGVYCGFSWDDMAEGLTNGVTRALTPVFIIIIVGIIIATWIQGGIIPSLIYYSLQLISPQIFVPATALVTAIIATAIGTSFTSLATIGLALMTTGVGLGFPAPLLAGAIISGAYFGDSLSPLSDSINLGAAMNGVNLYDLIKHMTKTHIPALLISLVIFFFLGLPYVEGSDSNLESIQTIMTGLEGSFVISPWLLLVPLLAMVFSIRGVQAVPSLIGIATLGALAAFFVQGASVGGIVQAMTNGFVSETGVELVDNLLTRGGMNSMGNTVILLISAVALGGILEAIGALDLILQKVLAYVKSAGSLVAVTALSSLIIGVATGAQLLAIMLPARMYHKAYVEADLHPKNLSRVSVAVGAIGINLVPWSVPALFAQSVLGVPATSFIPYIVFAHVILIVNILYGYTGFTMDPLGEIKTKTKKEGVVLEK